MEGTVRTDGRFAADLRPLELSNWVYGGLTTPWDADDLPVAMELRGGIC